MAHIYSGEFVPHDIQKGLLEHFDKEWDGPQAQQALKWIRMYALSKTPNHVCVDADVEFICGGDASNRGVLHQDDGIEGIRFVANISEVPQSSTLYLEHLPENRAAIVQDT